MRIGSYIEGPLLQLSFLIFAAGIVVRLSLYTYSIIRSHKNTGLKWSLSLSGFKRFWLPFRGMALLKRSLASLPQYVFHLCLIIVPIWTLGHVTLWEESRLGWSWTSLPDKWSDVMTLVVIFLAGWFLVRRIVLLMAYREGHISDCLLIVITALPFVTGYFLTHGSPGFIPIPADDMWTIHVLSGEIILVVAGVLFCRVRLNERACIGCVACGFVCPTRALEHHEHGGLRSLIYGLSQCICCGACRQACPENAIRLQHEISLTRIFRLFSREEIYSTELVSCQMCQKPFASISQLEKAGEVISDEQVYICENCKRTKYASLCYEVMA